MFQRENVIKKISISLLDSIVIILSFGLAIVLRFLKSQDITNNIQAFSTVYTHVLMVAVLVGILSNMAFRLDKHFFDRGAYQESLAVLKSAFSVFVIVLAYLYMTQEGAAFSRTLFALFLGIFGLLDYLGHQLFKYFFSKYYRTTKDCKKLMLISSTDKVESILLQLKKSNNWYFELSYITLIDEDWVGKTIEGIPVIGTKDTMLEATKNITLDGVFINISHKMYDLVDVSSILKSFQSLGLTVHVNIDALELDVTNKTIGNIGFFKVVSYKNKVFDTWQLIVKRCMDIVGAMIGLVITVILSVFIIPMICLESKGSPIFPQIRVGKNGRHFRMYKFRSMYKDAEQRKIELQKENEMNGAIFKIENDPRITKVGRILRKYSLDELPQFWNVFKGDMSLVGTRPPLVEEVENYQIMQKARLSVTPGLTGLWQTSGRSDIKDFEEIVNLDLEYINNWSIGLDIKLLFKTMWVCMTGKGAK